MASVLFVLNASTGGAGLSARELMGQLKGLGHRIYVVCPPNMYQPPTQVFGDIAEEVAECFLPSWNKKYRMHWAKRPLYFVYQQLKSRAHLQPVSRLVRLIRKWDIDIVHTNTGLTIDGALAAKVSGLPHVWHIREEIGAKALFRWSLPEPLLARVFAALSSQIVTNSKFSQAFFVRNGCEAKTRVVYNGLDLSRFASSTTNSPLRAQWSFDQETVVFGMLANVTSHFKRHEVFIRAAATLAKQNANARFVLVGFDPLQEGGYRRDLAYAKHLREVVSECGLTEQVIWSGFQSDIPAVVHALDVLVHPCENEGFGRIAVEAMAAKLPVIATNSGGIAEIVNDQMTDLLVAPGSVAEFGNAMESLYENKTRRTSMGEAGRTRAEELFQLQDTVNQVAEVYKEVLARR